MQKNQAGMSNVSPPNETSSIGHLQLHGMFLLSLIIGISRSQITIKFSAIFSLFFCLNLLFCYR